MPPAAFDPAQLTAFGLIYLAYPLAAGFALIGPSSPSALR
jgi:hypothetical protein